MDPYQLAGPDAQDSKWAPTTYHSRTESYEEHRDRSKNNDDAFHRIPRHPLSRHQTSSTASEQPPSYPWQSTATVHSTVPLQKANQHPRSDSIAISWWWWWEIGGAILSIASLGMIVLVLLMVNNKPVRWWSLPIQPNSLIAIFTTVGKTAMLVPTAACISQLKWRHFHLRANRVSHLQLFDDGSRGPWGALMMLWGVRSRAITAYALALVTILALGIEPSAQQILEFRDGATRLENTTAKIGMAKAYTSKNYIDGQRPTETTIFKRRDNKTSETEIQLTDLELSLTSTALRQPLRLPFDCPFPATECHWDTFTSLGICGEIRNVTDQVTGQCTADPEGTALDCLWNFDSISTECHAEYQESFFPGADSGIANAFYRSQGGNWCRRSDGSDAMSWLSMKFPVIEERPTENVDGEDVTQELKADTFYGLWSWCARTFDNITSAPVGINYGTVTEEKLTWISLESEETNIYRANSTGEEYRVSDAAMTSLSVVLSDLLPQRLVSTKGFQGFNTLSIGTFLFTADPANFMQDVAETLSTFVRTNGPGDNLNATTWEGDAVLYETYFHVRWEWLILPLAVALIATILLVVSIVLTWGQPLLKSSVIALLFHGLDGWSQQELRVPSPETIETLEAVAADFTARLGDDEQGEMKFVRSYG